MIVSIVAVVGWALPARLIRGMVLSGRTRDYVVAARALGGSDLYVLRRHVLPQVLGVVLTQAALLAPQYILAEATLSFFGLGVGGTRTELGKYVGGPSTVRCIVVVLVDVPACGGTARSLSVVLPARRCLAPADGRHAGTRVAGARRRPRVRGLMTRRLAALTLALTVVFATGAGHASQQVATATEWLVSRADVGHTGGQLVVIERAEPRTFNPVVAVDAPSKEIVARTTADLIHIDRETQQPQPALARSWTVVARRPAVHAGAAPRRPLFRWPAL